MLRLVLRADAVAYAAFGLVMLAAPWDAAWDALDLPPADPALWAQLAGTGPLGLAYLLWIAPRDDALARATALAAGVANALAATILAVWLVEGDLRVGALGKTLLALTAAAAAVFAFAEVAVASRRLAPLLPLH